MQLGKITDIVTITTSPAVTDAELADLVANANVPVPANDAGGTEMGGAENVEDTETVTI